jgi:nitrile hydratase
VRVADPAAADHTRLPGYLRHKTGTISEVYQDAFGYFCSTGPDGLGAPMPVYRVAFAASDIWGPELCEPNTTICADLFEVYLQSPNV